MPRSKEQQLSYKEGDLLLAISAIKRGQIGSILRAAKTYNVPENTLRRRLAGVQSRRDYALNSRKLSKSEENVLTQHLIDLDLRGFRPKL
jgi:hypothetical protein